MTTVARRAHAEVGTDEIAVVRLDHPPANALDTETCEALAETLRSVASARAIVLTGEGRLFCGGGDLGSFVDGEVLSVETLSETAHAGAEIVRALRAGPPVVAALNGAVAGAGVGLAVSCDVRISAPGVRFVGGFGALGLSPDTGTSYFLPRTVSRSRALRLLLDPAGISANQALAWGLVDEIAPEGTVLEAARTVAAALGRAPRGAVVASRALIDATDSLEAHLQAEIRSLTSLAADPSVAERVGTFLAGGRR
ncbi:enoyl-CoA hydratase/isomerase family protein [Blastococcus tunisiensis]|uniref:2-(1,2-epoxy-1,2-dihydrophenyl)acetyl-CoA isomerase n=1 Tax=Blastococcus tunisiensis TaxID=1798228 RepID=A0A1I2A8Y9_9ACTN|nr:enoyl-CoA hydratase/isomerase family protein [Blastococcus sp. DSM 46838]SFE40421.1 2-(1,2-epoxy-1,2-dihydrophenyl)acetyl-CoA isomerase [Blastococcus sp. DSM 46838]